MIVQTTKFGTFFASDSPVVGRWSDDT